MKLFYAPGSSSLFPHIVLHEADLPFEPVKIDEHTKAISGGGDYRSVNPLGYVPALMLDDPPRSNGPLHALQPRHRQRLRRFARTGTSCRRKAIEINSSFALGYLVLGMARFFNGEAENAVQLLQHGLKLNPNDPQNFAWFDLLALAQLFSGKPQEDNR